MSKMKTKRFPAVGLTVAALLFAPLITKPAQGAIERVLQVRPIESVIAVAAAQDEFSSLKLRPFVLHRLKREEA